ncbi:MAG: recombinase family protein [Verrucomicrobiota bacterium]
MPKAYSYIRFSSPEQHRGDSLRRQRAAAENYISEHPELKLHLDEDVSMLDSGISAYNQDNVSKGALGRFMDTMREGKIEKGSYLLIESLDRMSRAEPYKSALLLLEIVKAGIKVVTLFDEKIYSENTLNFDNLILAICTFKRAHDESETKSKRIKSVWSRKRGYDSVITKRCPHWLEFDENEGAFKPIPERVELLETIFQRFCSGEGKDKIARSLNKAGESPWGRGKGWHASYIQKIIRNRSVIGEFQPHELFDGKRIPVGEIKSGYYPAVISSQLFEKAQQRLSSSKHQKGKRSENFTNLFSGLVYSGLTGSSVIYVSKGSKKTQKYLVSSDAKSGLGEKYVSWRYDAFEISFLTSLRELDLNSLLPPLEQADNKSTEEIAKINQNLACIEKSLKNIQDGIERGSKKVTTLVNRMAELEEERAIILENLQVLQDEIETQNAIKATVTNASIDIKSLIEDRFKPDIRKKLYVEIHNLVGKIEIFFENSPFTASDGLASEHPDLPQLIAGRCFVIHFKSFNYSKACFPSKKDPAIVPVIIDDLRVSEKLRAE